jgi:hypothetical protein
MDAQDCFRLPRILLPAPGIDLSKWAVIACDQYTSEPEYWRAVEREVGDAPSTLPSSFPKRTSAHRTRRRASAASGGRCRYLDELLRDRRRDLVERMLGSRVRRGVMLELDLDAYDPAASRQAIRPTGTMVDGSRRGSGAAGRGARAAILVLIDDPAGTVIEPVGAERGALAKLYETELMRGGGRVAGYAVDAPRGARLVESLRALADPRAFAARYGVPAGTPVMLFAVGDGNHSLATAKAYWESVRGAVGSDHPSRYALVEVENIHDPALEFSPIHRLLFGVSADVRRALAEEFGDRLSCIDVPSAAAMRERVRAAPGSRHAAGLIGPGARCSVIEVAEPRATLAVGTLQPFLDRFIERGGAADVDYVHGDDALERLAAGAGNVGIHLPALGKADLLRMVVREGPLPRKAFSMGEADEKRFYVEARRIR